MNVREGDGQALNEQDQHTGNDQKHHQIIAYTWQGSDIERHIPSPSVPAFKQPPNFAQLISEANSPPLHRCQVGHNFALARNASPVSNRSTAITTNTSH